MKASKISLRINTPCTETWNNLTPNTTGKYCSSCSKNVIDFTGLTDSQVLDIISKSDGKMCGRLRADQVDRVMVIRNQQSVGSRIYALLSGLLMVGFSETSYGQKNERTSKPFSELTVNYNEYTGNIRSEFSVTDSVLIKGIILDESNQEPLIGVAVYIKGINLGTVTDVEGKFILEFPLNSMPEIITLVASYTGYSLKEIILTVKNPSFVKITLLYNPFLMLQGVVCGGITSFTPVKKAKWWQWKKKRAYKNTIY